MSDDSAAHASDSASTNDSSSEHNYVKHDTLEVSLLLPLVVATKKMTAAYPFKAKEKCLLSQKKYDSCKFISNVASIKRRHIFIKKSQRRISALSEHNVNESKATHDLEKKLNACLTENKNIKNQMNNIKAFQSTLPCFSASQDTKIFHSATVDKNYFGLLEIKCLYKHSNFNFAEAAQWIYLFVL